MNQPTGAPEGELSKSFEPAELEARWYQAWEQRGYFAAGQHVSAPGATGEPYVIQFPPPNVTGTLHMGHAFNQTIMDSLTRYHRMAGTNTAWIPGTDHAAILAALERRAAEAAEALVRAPGRAAYAARIRRMFSSSKT